MLLTRDIILFLLSSVLVSSESNQKRGSAQNEVKVGRKEDDRESDEIAEAVIISEAKRGAPHPQLRKHLDTKWTFWYESKAKREKTRNLSKVDYLKEVKRGRTFDTISDFWDCWNQVQQFCHPSLGDCNYELFKHGIKPIWEDPKNIKGGKCVLSIPRTTFEDTMKQWVSLMITLLIGEFGPDVNGVVLSSRPWGNIFSVWVRNSKDKENVDNTVRHLRDLFGPDVQIRFQRHQSSMRKKLVNNKPENIPYQQYQEKGIFESEASSFEGFEQKERNKGKEEPRRLVGTNLKGFSLNIIQEDKVRDETIDKKEKIISYQTSEIVTPERSFFEKNPTFKRRSSFNTQTTKPPTKKEMPKLNDFSTKEIGVTLAILLMAVLVSILSWNYLY